MLAAKILAETLGNSKIYLAYRVKGNVPNRASNDIIVGRAFLYERRELGKEISSCYGLSFLAGKGKEESDYLCSKAKKEWKRVELSFQIPPPYFVIDLRYWKEMREFERSSLIQQCVLGVSLFRNWMTERNLIFTSVPEEFFHKFKLRISDFRGDMFVSSFEEILPKDKVAVLDPLGEEELERKHFSEFKYFVIGGIVDKGERLKGATSEMGKGFPRIRISLRGSTLGVPDRINRILEICVNFYLGEPLEEAIKKAQARMIARKRLPTEISKRALRFEVSGKRYYGISESDLRDLLSFLNFEFEDFEKLFDREILIIKDELAEKIRRSEAFESYGRKIYLPKISEEELKKGVLRRIVSEKRFLHDI